MDTKMEATQQTAVKPDQVHPVHWTLTDFLSQLCGTETVVFDEEMDWHTFFEAAAEYNNKYGSTGGCIGVLPKADPFWPTAVGDSGQYLTARQFEELFDLLSPFYTNSWSRGEFSIYIKDQTPSPAEATEMA